MTALLVAVGAAVGAPLRYALDRVVRRRLGTYLPWGILVVNVLGSLALGVITHAVAAGAWSADASALLGTGVCGGFTTFSTLCLDTWQLVENGTTPRAAANLTVSLLAGLTAATGGWVLTGLFL